MEDIEGPARGQYYLFHKSFGLLALLLVLCRIVWRASDRPPAPSARSANLADQSGGICPLGALCADADVCRAVGYLLQSYSGRLMNWFGIAGLPVPSLTAPDNELRETLGDVHGTLAWALLVVIGLHVGAALFHHFVKKDATLARMTPFIKS
jgi:cytochrome b561